MQAAEGRHPPLLCDTETVEAAKEVFNFKACTPVQVKGKEFVFSFPRSVVLYESHAIVCREPVSVAIPAEKLRSPATRRPPNKPLLGRERELSALKAVIEKTIQTQAGQVVLLKGYPGSGKTTLLQHIIAQMQLHSATMVCRESGRGGAFGVVARLLVAMLEARHLMRQRSEKKRTLQELIKAYVALYKPPLLIYLALLNSVLGLKFPATAASTLAEGPQKKEMVYDLLCTILDCITREPKYTDSAPKHNTTVLVINVRVSPPCVVCSIRAFAKCCT